MKEGKEEQRIVEEDRGKEWRVEDSDGCRALEEESRGESRGVEEHGRGKHRGGWKKAFIPRHTRRTGLKNTVAHPCTLLPLRQPLPEVYVGQL